MKKVGLIGFGRIGSSLYEKINSTEDVRVSLVYEMVEELTKDLDSKIIAESPDDFFNQDLDLVIEAAAERAKTQSERSLKRQYYWTHDK